MEWEEKEEEEEDGEELGRGAAKWSTHCVT